MAKLPEKRQQAIKKRAAELIAEEATLRQLREAQERSQEEVAKKLHINQAGVSKLERRTDMYLSTFLTCYGTPAASPSRIGATTSG
jgi:DNA-directed RNA polymerase specialized sigma subunit